MIDLKKYNKLEKNYIFDLLYRKGIMKIISDSYGLLKIGEAINDKWITFISLAGVASIYLYLNKFINDFIIFQKNMATLDNEKDEDYLKVKDIYKLCQENFC